MLHQAPITCQMVTVVLADAGQDEDAAQILGRVDHHAAIHARRCQTASQYPRHLERRLGERFGQLLDNGASMTTPQTIDLALESLTQLAGRP